MSEVKVNKISPRTACGTTTLGDSGDTFTIPAGVTITNSGTAAGFGATGAASWDTTVKTGDFTAVNGVGYFVNTTSGEIDITLPAGTAGDVVAISDYANNFATANCILIQNGSDKIGGSAVNATLSTNGVAVTLVFVDATKGWIVTDSGNQSETPTSLYVTATGGTVTCSGDYRIHTFTGPGAFCVSCAGNAVGSTELEYIVVAGGAGAGGCAGNTKGGGGAGGFRFAAPSLAPLTYPAKPLAAPASITAAVQSYPIVIGAGGAGSSCGAAGAVSTFSTITSTGGATSGGNGGSGGGAPGGSINSPGGTGNSPPVSPAQGTNGGKSAQQQPDHGSGGGGGSLVAGSDGRGPSCTGRSGPGGAGGGLPSGFGANGQSCGTFRYYAGGGGGGGHPPVSLNAGVGGLGGGASGSSSTGSSATTNTGGGGGGGGPGGNGGSGGSGIVIIRYKFQN